MPFWKSSTISPSSSSSSPKSSPSSPSKQKFTVWNRKESHQHQQQSHTHSEQQSRRIPCLTRQRKLRHLTDADIRDLSLNPRRTSSALGDSTPLPSSPSSRSSTSARMSSVVPLPLPPPDLSTALRSGASGLSSPMNADRLGDRATSVPSTWGKYAHPSVSKGMEHVEVASGVSTLGHRKKVQDPGVAENIQKTFRISVSADSAPTSGISSPILSPRRLSSADFFPSSYMSNKCLPWSDPEYHAPDMTLSPRTSPEKFFPSPDLSPLHSPGMKSPVRKSNNPSGASTPLHPRMSLEGAAAAWHDSNGNVAGHPHPLPRPPGAMVHSQPSSVHQATAKSEFPSRINQWQKGKLIGSGTFGNVYVATNRETGASCAMKEVNLIPDDPKSAESIKQLEQEIRVLSHLKHPNIVQYYGSEIVEDRFYIFLEYVHPGSISKYVRDNFGAMTESVVRNFTRHILHGLAFLHSQKTIHRDIKGANLLVDASGVVKLADFGMAKHLSGPAAALSLKGSPYWMAPEVMHAMMQKDSGYDVAVDIWSLGCTIIEMLTGKPPWSEYEGAAAMFKVMKNESPPIPDALSPEGKNFLHCCLQRNPVERPSAMQLLEHPFIKNSINQEISGGKSMDNMVLPSPRDRTSFMPLSPGRTVSYQLPNVQTGQSYHETSESAVASRHSPRSILEAIPSLSPPRSNHSNHGNFSSK